MIALSGIDCSGKSTQAEMMCEELRSKGIRAKIVHSRVGYTPLLEFFKKVVRRDKGFSEEEKELYRKKIHSSGKKRKLLLWLSISDIALYYGVHFRLTELFGRIIIADRYFADSLIDLRLKFPEYGFEDWKVWRICEKIYLKPKISILYVIPPELSMYRSTLKEEPFPEPLEKRRIRIEKYLEMANCGVWQNIIDASEDKDEVFRRSMEYVNGRKLK